MQAFDEVSVSNELLGFLTIDSMTINLCNEPPLVWNGSPFETTVAGICNKEDFEI